MLDFGNDLAQVRELLGPAQHGKAHQFGLVVSSDQFLTEEESGELSLDRLNVLTVVPESAPLADGRFVENLRHPTHKGIVEGRFAHVDSCLLTLPYHVSRRPLNLLVPPMVIGLNWQNANGLPFRVRSEERRVG